MRAQVCRAGGPANSTGRRHPRSCAVLCVWSKYELVEKQARFWEQMTQGSTLTAACDAGRMSHRPEVILVHGLWHQPAHFDRLTAVLRAHGIGVHVPRLHRGSLANDTAAVQSIVAALPVAPVVLGHSYGGSVITGLDRVRHLIYVAAFVPAAGESGALLGGTGALVNDAVRRNADGTTSIATERAREFLYADCTDSLGAWASGLLVPQQPGHGRGVPQRVAWTNVESTYVKCEQDRALSPALQEQMALRCTHVVRLPSSHSPFVSQPLRLGAVIMKTCRDLAALTTG